MALNRGVEEPLLAERSKNKVKNAVLRFIEGVHHQDPPRTGEGKIEEMFLYNLEPKLEIEKERSFPPLNVEEEITSIGDTEDGHQPEFMLPEGEATKHS